jgi:hypothetical protein
MIALCATVNVSAPKPNINRPPTARKNGMAFAFGPAFVDVDEAANATIRFPKNTNKTHINIPTLCPSTRSINQPPRKGSTTLGTE